MASPIGVLRLGTNPPEQLVWLWLDELLDRGVRQIAFSGGEPTLHRALPEMLKHAQHRGARVELWTNAIKLARPVYLARLIDAGLGRVRVLLTADRQTRAGIRCCLRAGIAVTLDRCVDQTIARVHQDIDHLERRFLDAFPQNPIQHFYFSHPTPFQGHPERPDSLVSLAVARPHLAAATRRLAALGVNVLTDGVPLCAFGDALPQLTPPPAAITERVFQTACAGCVQRGACAGFHPTYPARFGEAGVRPFLPT